MINKSLRKNIFREMRATGGRFIAIFAITALGAGFFAGLKATGPNMRATADKYYADQHLMDYRLLSTLGFTDEDVEALRALPEVENVMATQGLDVLVQRPDGEDAVRLHALPEDTGEENPEYLNRLVLTEGRMPQTAEECVVDSMQACAIGDVVQLSPGNSESVLEMVKPRRLVVVGKVESPYYISLQRGNTNIGSGRIAYFIYLPQSAFDSEVYTEIYLTASGALDVSNFSAEYETLVDSGKARLEPFGEQRAQNRYDTLYNDADKELKQARKDLDAARADADEQLADAWQTLQDAEKQVEDARKQITDTEKLLRDAEQEIATGEKELADGQSALATAKTQYETGLAQYNTQKAAYDDGLAQYNTQKAAFDGAMAQLDALDAALNGIEDSIPLLNGYWDTIQNGTPEEQAIAKQGFAETAGADITAMRLMAEQLQAAGMESEAGQLTDAANLAEGLLGAEEYATVIVVLGAVPGAARPSVQASRQQLEAQRPLLEAAKKELDDAYPLLVAAKNELDDAKTQIDDGQAKLDGAAIALQQAKDQVATGQSQLATARIQLADAEIALADGKATYETEKADADTQFGDAEQEILDGQKKLDELEEPEWFVFTREDNPGYSGFSSDTNRINAIAAVIPVFFYLVAALVCLTTMTRMVEEQRTQIGTLKALGFSRGAIAFKYIFYAGFASATGAIAGVLVGFVVFPSTIWNAYHIIYATMPGIHLERNLGLALLSILTTVLCTTLAAFAACYSELRSVPAQLMRPKAPKAGKRVFLERIPFLWRHMKFSLKVTARNLFRYKKRFFMTIIGVAGCTALLVTGFGLRDSITGIVDHQYGRIDQYDMVATLKDPADGQADTALNRRLPDFGEGMYVQQTLVDAKAGNANNNGMTTYLLVMEDPARAEDFIHLHTRQGQEPVPYPAQGAVITEKLALRLNVEIGDSIQLNRVNEKPVDVVVAGISENYIFNYVYMAPDVYQTLFGETPEYNQLLLLLPEEPALSEEETLAQLIETEGVAGAVDIDYLSSSITDMLESLNSVVWLIIISAGLLAFVVLYNLTNINITERAREIATLKVLGFHNSEVAGYVYRENIVLTLIGIALGLVLGVFLHQFVIQTAEVDEVMFRRVVLPMSYVWSSLFTLLSAGLVNLVMLPKLRRIDMVESLKSAE